MKKIAIYLFLIIFNFSIFSEDSLISGYVMSFDYIDITRPFSEIDFYNSSYNDVEYFKHDRAGLRLQLRVNSDLTKDISTDITFNIEENLAKSSRQPNSSAGENIEIYFKEGFLTLRDNFSLFDLKIGRQYIFWGKFEWGGALDIISPWDFAKMAAEKENFRVAVDAIYSFFYFKDITFELLLIPLFTPNKINLKLPSKMGPIDVVQYEAEIPEPKLENTEIGARLNIPIGDNFSFTLTYFKGFDRNFSLYTELEIDTETDPDTYTLYFTPKYKKLQLFGIDSEYIFSWGKLIYEGGYFKTEDIDGDDIFISNSKIQNSIGTEIDISSSLSFTGLYSITYFLNYNRDKELENREKTGEPDPYVHNEIEHQIVWRLKYNFTQSFFIQGMQLINFPDINWMFLTFIGWNLSSEMKLYCGTVLFKGVDGTTFGRIEKQSRFFIELKYMF